MVCSLVLSVFSGYTFEPAESITPATDASQAIAVEEFKIPDIVKQTDPSADKFVGRVKDDETDLYSFVLESETGARTLKIFDFPVKYVDDNGQIKDISTDIKRLPDGSHTTAENNIKTTFSKKLTEGILLEYDDISIKIVPNDTAPLESTAINIQETEIAVKNTKKVSYSFGKNTNLKCHYHKNTRTTERRL